MEWATCCDRLTDPVSPPLEPRSPAWTGPARRGWGGATLRTRLLAVTVALLAAVSVVIAVVSVAAFQRFLVDRLDRQVTAAFERSRFVGDGPANGRRDGLGNRLGDGPPGGVFGANRGPGPLRVLGQAEGTLGAQVVAGVVVRPAVLGRDGDLETIAPQLAMRLGELPVDGRPRTLDLGGELGDYRVVAAHTPRGDTFVTGLPLGPVHATLFRLTGVITLVSLAGLLAAALVGAAVIRRTLSPLERVAATATRVSQLPLDRGDVALAVRVPKADTDPRTEVGQVGAALNHMLEHVASALRARQASETRVRQFVADASHELRTPLAVIRGYAELSRRGEHPVPEDVAHALQRVESEAVRMTVLVEDLLLLARLDAGRPVERAEVDLSALVVDALGDAHVAGPDHRWSLHLPEDPVIVSGAPGQLHQVVANLLANARVHTPPGTDVRVSLSTLDGSGGGPGAVLIEVVDNGPGIPAELVPGVFERFARADSSRSRAGGSTGLGLAIVAAVVAAHNGTVTVDSGPGGTAFAVRLPQHGDAQS